MLKILKIMTLSALILASACSKDENNKTEKLLIQSGETQYEYEIEVADTKETLYHGLMGRNSLPENSGMLFDITIVPKDLDVAMWMKDTLIPLDIIFIDENGEIFYIHENAEPNSTTGIIPPKRPRAVLELNAGQVKDKQIKVGDSVKNRVLGNLD
ncbi:MAG: DUF192 domain-containing protein [Pseudomonadota bacterium]|nr:DUF192 domain-containing protein [Pseudomonadota bacterium]